LIHGGLRYLESGQFSVVKECLHERSLLLKLAPELVKLVPFYIPIYRETSRRPWQIRAGLSLYSMLTGLHAGASFRKVPRREWSRLDGLNTNGLQAVYQYWDGQTDDAQLTRAVMASAQALGADLFQPAEFLGAALTGEGCRVEIRHQGQESSFNARVVVNAAGPWVNEVLAKITPQPSTLAVDLVQGSHLILDNHLQRGIYYLEAPQDRRAVFAIPWKDKLMLGTTEKLYQGDPAQVEPLDEERVYLLSVLARYFPQYGEAGRQKVLSSFAGLRVLPKAEGAAFGRSRETILHPDVSGKPRVLTIYGGKLTAYRATSERVMAMLQGVLPKKASVADTRTLTLSPQ
jgi:glycerol-3-phosphate dehydrogenase